MSGLQELRQLLLSERKENRKNIQYPNSEEKMKRDKNTDLNLIQNSVLTVKVGSIPVLMEV